MMLGATQRGYLASREPAGEQHPGVWRETCLVQRTESIPVEWRDAHQSIFECGGSHGTERTLCASVRPGDEAAPA
jgi:hypothetical protein